MCYRHATLTFERPCPECGSMQCNLSMYCEECGAELPYIAHPSQCERLAPSDADAGEDDAQLDAHKGNAHDSATESASPSKNRRA